MDTLAFILRYEAVLKERKIPKMQFYKECNISDAAVSQWRKGRTKPAMTTISRIAEYLGVTAEYLLTGEGQKEKAAQTGDPSVDAAIEEIMQIASKMTTAELMLLLERAKRIAER